MIFSARIRNALAAAAIALSSASGWAFQEPSEKNPAELLDDFTHYALIAHVELAAARAQQLMDSGITNAELAVLLDEGKVTLERFDRAIARAQMVPELEQIASELAHRVEEGRLDLARDPKRIDEAIAMLTGTQRQRFLADRRLVEAGEYAVPALLRQITEGQDPQLKLECEQKLAMIGRPAVYPLCTALPHLTGAAQRTVCDILGTIKNPHAAPYLRELSMDSNADAPAREAAERAFRAMGGANVSLSTLYSDLARQYFDHHESLVAYPDEPTNIVWSYSTLSGLSPTPVPTEIFNEIMAVRTASKALSLDPSNSTALSLFVAANLKRENDLPEGLSDPIYGEATYSPEFYATVFGTQTCLDVLGLAIDKLDTPLVRDAIAALAKTTGGANLFARGTGRQPLLEAMVYPDRRVQYEAALTLGRALPQQTFAGDHTVVPILASAVRMGNQSLAVVIVDDPEDMTVRVGQLERAGFTVVASGGSVAEVQPDIARAVGVDLVLIQLRSVNETRAALNGLRAIAKTSASPALVIASLTDSAALRPDYRSDHRVKMVPLAVNEEQLGANIEAVMASASGGRITEAEAEEYAIQALAVLRDVAISRSPAYSINDAESALMDALDTRSGGTRLLVAEILSLIDSDTAQRKLLDAALSASDDEQIALLKYAADSVRLTGDRAEQRHITALVHLLESSSGDVAEAAATLHGALNLSTTEAIKLIPQ